MAAGGIPFQFMGGMGPFGGGFPGVSFDMSEVFGNLFGGGDGRKSRKGGKGPNKYHDVGLRLADFFKGHDIKLKFNQARKCTGCSGSGAEASESCGACGGSGVRLMTRQIGPGMLAQTRAACDVCSGEGKRVIRQCRKCNGKKFTEQEKLLEIAIKPGMKDGEILTYAGECSDSPEYDSPGDVVLTLRRADMKDEVLDVYEWKQEDLLIRKQITYVESILGFTVVLDDHPNGLSPSFSWKGGPLIHGAVLEIPAYGMPKKNGGFGMLRIQVMITPPELKPWSPEDAAKLQSVFGGAASSFDNTNHQVLTASSPDSKLIVNSA
jgi:DnaJ family protein A protein 2